MNLGNDREPVHRPNSFTEMKATKAKATEEDRNAY